MSEGWIFRIFAAVLAVMALTACTPARPTVYQAANGGFGYSETRLESGDWQVAFTGNRMSPLATMENYALYRSAEIALREGFGQFAVIEQDSGRQVMRAPGLKKRPPPGFDSAERRRDATLQPTDPFVVGRTERTITNSAILIIRPYSGAAPAGAERSYSAKDVLMRLGPEITKGR